MVKLLPLPIVIPMRAHYQNFEQSFFELNHIYVFATCWWKAQQQLKACQAITVYTFYAVTIRCIAIKEQQVLLFDQPLYKVKENFSKLGFVWFS